ncbi:MAG: hypothetical protein EZS28_004241 [Streblomastix strix]|uniref:Uncharacterized protein n=1 Tax=Streblomastix strix TaxID=222440 RepID=A0A5J4X0G1_9EUKA|nr:MAG: hypothetical protein EZS28_004241 [Streblomastix strix]
MAEIADLRNEINQLVSTINMLASEGRYDDADQTSKRLDLARKKLSEKQRAQLLEEERRKADALRRTYNSMQYKFDGEWNEEMHTFEENASHKLEVLHYQQEQEYAELEAALQREIPIPPKPSNELINLRATEKEFAKLKKFPEAQRAKVKADALEEQERASFEKEDATRRAGLLNQLKQQHINEKNNLMKRLDKERKERQLARGNDISRLDRRFQKIQREQKNENTAKFSEFEAAERKFGVGGYGLDQQQRKK